MGDGKIHYSEFLAATIDEKQFLNEAKLRAVFGMFDAAGDNVITAEEMKSAFQKFGQHLTMDQINDMIEKHDVTKSGTITFDEFKLIFVP